MKAPISGTMWCVCHICFHAVLSRPDRTFVGRGNRWISLYTMAGLKLAGSRPRSSVRVATLRRVCSAPPLSASVWLCCTCCRHALLHVCVAGAGGSWPFTRHGAGGSCLWMTYVAGFRRRVCDSCCHGPNVLIKHFYYVHPCACFCFCLGLRFRMARLELVFFQFI